MQLEYLFLSLEIKVSVTDFNSTLMTKLILQLPKEIVMEVISFFFFFLSLFFFTNYKLAYALLFEFIF